MDIVITTGTILEFICIVAVGVINGYFMYQKGIETGIHCVIHDLESEGFLQVEHDGRLVRLSDRKYKKFKTEMKY